MPLNATDAERQKTANKQLAKKLVLERPMRVALKSLFSTIGKDLEAIFERTGQVPDATDYSIELSGILARQYRRTNSAFSGNITDFVKYTQTHGDLCPKLMSPWVNKLINHTE